MTEHDWVWLETLAHWLGAWTIVVLLIAGWLSVFRVRRSGLRYAGWILATFTGLLLLPSVGLLSPLATWQDFVASILPQPVETPDSPVEFKSWIPRQTGFAPVDDLTAQQPTAPPSFNLADTTSHTPSQVAASHNAINRPLWWAMVIWLGGMSIGLLRIAVHAIRVRKLIRTGNLPIPSNLAEQFRAAQAELNLKRRVRLLVHPNLPSPVCTGLWKPCVIWPCAKHDAMSPAGRRAAMLHELAHLRRYDDWVTFLAEFWRTVCWFYLPVHVTITRLRQEQEFLCDDVAAAGSERPEQYAQLLLDLTPIRLATNGLSAPFVGKTGMVQRIRRIAAGETRVWPPLRRASVLALVACGLLLLGGGGALRLVGLIERVEAAEPTDSPLPEITPQELSKKLKEAWAVYDRCLYEATFQREIDASSFGYAQEKQPPQIVKYPGRFRFAGDGRRWLAEYDSKNFSYNSTELRPSRWTAGFDGETHFYFQGDHLRLGVEISHDFGPRYLFMSPLGETLLKSFAEDDWELKSQPVVEGYRCYALQRDTIFEKNKIKVRTEVIISPRQSFLPISVRVIYNEEKGWSNKLENLEKSTDDVWFPRRVTHNSLSMDSKRESRITRFEVPKSYAPDYFAPEFAYGDRVQDYRLGINYIHDPWWPEMSVLLRNQFGWPPPDLVPLRDLSSFADPKMEGNDAPPLEVAQWISGEPINLANRGGKVTLLYFSTGSLIDPNQKWLAALRGLYQIYNAAGHTDLEIVGIQTTTDDIEPRKQMIREMDVPWPVAVDSPTKDSSSGRTFKAYGLKQSVGLVLIDQLGRVRLIETGQLLNVLNQHLGLDEETAPPEATLEFTQMPGEMMKQISSRWKLMVSKSPASGTIRGTITDGDGKPLAGVVVSAELGFHLSSSIHSPHSTYYTPYREKLFQTRTGKDGTFELTKLWKGTYKLSTHFAGKAKFEHMASLGPNFLPATVDFVLYQGDQIQGRVLDDAGKPLAGATVSTYSRHDDPENWTREIRTFGNENEVKTDADGRFVFSGLMSGGYTFNVTADGYTSTKLKHILTGTDDAEIRLSPAP